MRSTLVRNTIRTQKVLSSYAKTQDKKAEKIDALKKLYLKEEDEGKKVKSTLETKFSGESLQLMQRRSSTGVDIGDFTQNMTDCSNKGTTTAANKWDKAGLKALPALMRIKKEWMPPNWDQIMNEMKKEGRDVASLDADLARISKETNDEQKDTGKYLMEEDIVWCRGRTKFCQRDLIHWFKIFRKECNAKGKVKPEQIAKLFKIGFPAADEDAVVNAVHMVYERRQLSALDFKDFIRIMDAVTCKTVRDKLSWACGLVAPGQRPIDLGNLPIMLQLMDLAERNGFISGPSEDELNEILFSRPLDSLMSVQDRVALILERTSSNKEAQNYTGAIDHEAIVSLPASIVYAKD